MKLKSLRFYRNTHDENGTYRGDDFFGEKQYGLYHLLDRPMTLLEIIRTLKEYNHRWPQDPIEGDLETMLFEEIESGLIGVLVSISK